MNVHFNPVTGEIALFDNTLHKLSYGGMLRRWEARPIADSHMPGNVVTRIIPHIDFAPGQPARIDPKKQKIDIATHRLIDKTEAEQAAAHLPDVLDVKHVIAIELQHSDGFTVPDRPISDDVRAAWLRYRAALRRLSKLTDAAAMVKAWPARPDGIDPIPTLRSRVTDAEQILAPKS